jgi:DNA (cytosine-5)-methyltransferase 1
MGKLRTIDLFAGIGGIRKGFELTGKYETVFANDNDKNCKITYDLNFDSTRLTLGDIRKMSVINGDIPAFDILLGGFPCQPFSVAGLKKGFDDPKGRGTLIDDIVRLLVEAKTKYSQPKGFLLENVRNLVDLEDGAVYRAIRDKLAGLGYEVDYQIYNSLNFGLPQNRQRVYIVGFKDKAVMDHFKSEWPKPGGPSQRKVKDILEPNVDAKYYYNGKALFDRIKEDVINPDSVYLYRRNHVREHKSGYSPTLVASMGQGGHNIPIVKDSKGLRRLTPRECAILQGFDDLKIPLSIPEVHVYKQIGNSVSVPVMFAIARKMAIVLESSAPKNPLKVLETSKI